MLSASFASWPANQEISIAGIGAAGTLIFKTDAAAPTTTTDTFTDQITIASVPGIGVTKTTDNAQTLWPANFLKLTSAQTGNYDFQLIVTFDGVTTTYKWRWNGVDSVDFTTFPQGQTIEIATATAAGTLRFKANTLQPDQADY